MELVCSQYRHLIYFFTNPSFLTLLDCTEQAQTELNLKVESNVEKNNPTSRNHIPRERKKNPNTMSAPSSAQQQQHSPTLPFRNLYDLLKVPHDATMVDIRRAYRRRALESHPDKQQQQKGGRAEAEEDEGASNTAPSSSLAAVPPPFIVLASAATLLLDPIRRKQYDNLLFLNKLSSIGRVSNADEVVFGLVGDSADGEFEVIADDDDDEGEDADAASKNSSSTFRWCGLECRCGGWYRVAIPSVFFAPSSSSGEDEKPKLIFSSSSSSLPSDLPFTPTFRTVHVECESCSLLISVEKVPTLSALEGRATASSGVNNQQPRDAGFNAYAPLFLGLEGQ